MKKSQTTFKLVFAFICAAIIFNSCKEEDVRPWYEGIWVTSETVHVDTFDIEIKDIISLDEHTYTNTSQIRHAITGQWVNYFGIKGTYDIDSVNLNLNVDFIGFSVLDSDSIPTGQIIYYEKGTSEYAKLLVENELEETIYSVYELDGNAMSIMTDHNLDGDYADEYETSLYRK